jgi:uncharacterized protein YegJ (DUF2314 family)
MLNLLRKLFRRGNDLPPVALVALETTPRFLSRAQIATAVSKAIGADFSVESVIEEAPEKHRFTVEGYVFTFVSRFGPYIPKNRAPHKDLRLQAVLDRQESALLLDVWEAPEGRLREESTDLMGRILIEVADETTVGVFCFHTQRLNPLDEILIELFREGRASEAMETYTADGVSTLHADDVRMTEAIAEARRRWPEFVEAFQTRSAPDSGYGIKAPFEQGDRVEHLWIEVDRADAVGATGKVVSRPIALARPRYGDEVTVAANEVTDWAFQDGERTGGSFSDAIVREAL